MQSANQLKKTFEAPKKIHFVDLEVQQQGIRGKIDDAIRKVLDHGIYIMGPEIALLEKKLSDFCGAKHAITCSNGTDALALGLRAFNVRPGDAVLVPSFTFAATAEVVTWFGATPIFVDVKEDTFTMDPVSLEKGIALAKNLGFKPRGIIPVDLFGLPADYEEIENIAETRGLWIIADAAQSFGASYKNRKVGTIGQITTTSFFPAKPLGCYGDGGALFTDNDDLAAIIRSARVHGQGSDKYDNVRIGMNGRLDTIQAAILIEKLAIFKDEIEARNRIAKVYHEGLGEIVKTPIVPMDFTSVWAQYTLCLGEEIDRKSLMASLQAKGIPTVVYYVKPLHLQTAYNCYPCVDGNLPVSEKLSRIVLSLPMHAYLQGEAQAYIIEYIRQSLK